jgi:hypothetical protein
MTAPTIERNPEAKQPVLRAAKLEAFITPSLPSQTAL